VEFAEFRAAFTSFDPDGFGVAAGFGAGSLADASDDWSIWFPDAGLAWDGLLVMFEPAKFASTDALASITGEFSSTFLPIRVSGFFELQAASATNAHNATARTLPHDSNPVGIGDERLLVVRPHSTVAQRSRSQP